MIRRVFIILVVWLLAATVLAGNDGGTESVFSLGAGARAMGMGNSFTAIADDATAVYYNPAGLYSLNTQQITFLHTILFEGTIYDFIAYVYPTHEWGGFGLAAMRLGTDDIGRRDYLTSEPADEDLARFSASQLQFLLSFGRPITEKLSAGISLKLAHQSIDDLSAYGYGFDLGARYQINNKLRAGVLLQDLIGARLKLVTIRERTPFTLRTGLAYDFEIPRRPITGTVSLDMEKPENRNIKIRTGFEAHHISGLTLRAGYDRDNITLGLGLKYENMNFDYAYKFVDDLSDSHRFSFTFGFGSTKEEFDARKESELRYKTLQLANEQRRESLKMELEAADNYYAAGELDSALAAYYRADAFALEKEYIRNRISEIKNLLDQARTDQVLRQRDTLLIGKTVDFESQARSLYNRELFTAARDIVALARSTGAHGESLNQLSRDINMSIDSVIQENLSRGSKAMDEANYIAAYDAYNTVLKYDVSNKEALEGSQQAQQNLTVAQHLNLAMSYFNQNRYVSARREFRAILEIDPNNKTALDYLDQVDLKIKASTTLEDLQKDERIWQIYLNGLEAFRQGRYNDAIEYWQEVLKVYPNNKNTQENIEQARLRLDNKQ